MTTAKTTANELAPLDALPANRPRLPERPCAACGQPNDPLRCERALPFDDGVRLFCDDTCVQAFRGGKRFRPRPTPQAKALSEDHLGAIARARSEATSGGESRAGRLPREVAEAPKPNLTPADAAPFDEGVPGALWLGLGFAVAAALMSPLGSTPGLALVSAGFTIVAVLCALWLSRSSAQEIGVAGWLLGPIGGLCAAISAYQVGQGPDQTWTLAGAALAALALLARAFLDSRGQAPLEAALGALEQSIPQRVRVPVADADDPFDASLREVSASSVRTGESVVANRGDRLGVDGVIQAGSARIKPHPRAAASYQRGVGDAVIAGAEILEGGIRVMATRVADQRTLARVAHVGRRTSMEGATHIQLSEFVRRWGAAIAAVLAVLTLLSVDSGRLAAPLAAAATVLLVAPLLTQYRAMQAPLVAAATHASGRGIFFHDAAALERAGSVTVAAMAPHRTLTEGQPEVVEVYVLGEGSADDIIAEVAAAERVAAPDHAIARAIITFAEVRKVPEREVRRATYQAGRGVTAVTQRNEELIVGNRRYLLDAGVSVAVADVEAARAENAGRSPVFVAMGGRVRAVITVEDHLRVGARAALQRMFDMDLEVVLVTGDQRGPSEKLARALDVEHVKAELLPEERVSAIRSLREGGSRVAMVGLLGAGDEGLAAADVGVILGGAGGGRERTVATVSEDIRDAAAALWIARAARTESLRSLQLSATAFFGVAVAAAAGLMVPGIAALIALAVDAHGLSTGTRLLRRFALRLPA